MKQTRAYLVVLSKGDPIKIDQEEFDKVINGISTKAPIIVKRGLINPSYVVSVISDKERMREWNENRKYNVDAEMPRLLPMYPVDSEMYKILKDKTPLPKPEINT